MRLNKKTQYGMLLVLYICRSGRTTIDSAAQSLRLSSTFLEQVARKLRLAGVLKSVRGHGGGYELTGDPTVSDVFDALSPLNLLTTEEQNSYRLGHAEHRAFVAYVTNLGRAMSPVLGRKVRNVSNELVATELAALNRANEATPV